MYSFDRNINIIIIINIIAVIL